MATHVQEGAQAPALIPDHNQRQTRSVMGDPVSRAGDLRDMTQDQGTAAKELGDLTTELLLGLSSHASSLISG